MESQLKAVRFKYVDAIKGFAILLVVLGHSIQKNVVDFDSNFVFKLIYSFHMPLFMFVSGYLTKLTPDSNFAEFIKKKFNILVIPFISWYLFGYIILLLQGQAMPFVNYIYQLIKSPDCGLWFFWILFLNCIVLSISVKLVQKLRVYAFFIVLILLNLFHWGMLGINLLQWQYTFFLAGYLVHWYLKVPSANFDKYKTIPFVLYPILLPGWHRIEDSNLVQKMREIIPSHKIFIYIINAIYGRLIAFSAIACVFYVFEKIDKSVFNNSKIYNGLCWFGMYTFEIYAIHQLVLLGFGHGVVRIVSCFIISISISLLASFFIIKRSKILSKFFLGSRA